MSTITLVADGVGKTIQLPVNDGITTVTVNGTGAGYSVSNSGTLVTLNSTPTAGQVIVVSFIDKNVNARGVQLLFSREGSINTPAALLNGISNASFVTQDSTLGSGGMLIPANTLVPGKSSLKIEAVFTRYTALAACSYSIRIGTSQTFSANPQVQSITGVSAASARQYRTDINVSFADVSTLSTDNWISPQSQQTNAVLEITTNIDTTKDMYLNFNIEGANVGDYFGLVRYRVLHFKRD